MPMRGRRKEIKMSPMKMDRIMTKVGSNTEINFAICLSVSGFAEREIILHFISKGRKEE